MVKINNKRKLKYYLKDYDSGKSSQKSAARALGITPRRFRQIHAIYKSTGEIPAIGVGLGRPRQDIPKKWKEIIKQEYEMLEFGFAKEQESIPQTNGKQEKFHDFYKNHRGRFESLDKMIEWYNNRPHGSLNLRRAETPNQAFIRKMHPEVWLGFVFKMFGWRIL